MSDTTTPTISPDPEKEEEADRDDALDDTFPASDPISIGGSTGPDDTLEEK